MSPAPVAALRRFVPARPSKEKCDACGVGLPPDHIHQFDPKTRLIHCACPSCAALYRGTYLDIPPQVIALPNFAITDTQWDDLLIPISLAFFTYSSAAGRVIALYPGPAGASESLLRLDAWEDIAAANPELLDMQPDVQALLVNRVGAARDYFIVPIDECYKLVGLIRLRWSGLSGGAVVWGEIAAFFDGLRRKGSTCRT
ncbi:MAG TPA: DUF5947 family protein [Bryobacteraceae bacterium]|jgi:hypothetical protein|nr:DUF5947 family protein [Bryobacteraceae bacterium]